jgi:peptide/nickel transport system permease protein
MAGALITESVFNYPGMGFLFYQSAQGQDYPTLLGFIIVVAIATVVGSLLAGMAYAALDPRVRYAWRPPSAQHRARPPRPHPVPCP